MKKEIHPEFYEDALVVCSCGASFRTGSTRREIHIEICGSCHPVYTGQRKIVDTAGRVEQFERKFGKDYQRFFAPETAKEES
ncbi:MAG: 50S ribosomal protein L31 [bacterium JZ-2024 1]